LTSPSTTASSPSAITERGFTLTELAVVLTIVALLLSTLMYTLAAHTDQRAREDTASRLEAAKELLLGFAITHGRLPCPASATSNGDEAPAGGPVCSNYLNGFLPATTIGFRPVDSSGYAVDAWGNRIRYALAKTVNEPSTTSATCSTDGATDVFSSKDNLKTSNIGCAPMDIVICDATQSTVAGVPPSCGPGVAVGDAKPVTNQRTVVALVFSIGKNGNLTCATCTHEAANTDGNGVFVWHEQRPTDGTGGEFDDQMVWIPVGLLYGRMIAAGVLP
jgi:prepilin-type N-terminal cleavage/methylation domain-containing protein